VPTNKQRREAARRHLERQLQRRIETDVKRKRRNLVLTIVGSIVVVVVIVVAMVALVHDDKKSTASAAASSSAPDTSSASPTASASTTAAPQPQTAGPCGYTQTATPATKDVGFPPDPNPTPTTNRVMSITTNKGPITMTLNAAIAPCTVQSLTYLANKGYYDNTNCFRLVTSGIFVLQCGDPANAGTGGPGYESKDENLTQADYSVPGTVAMANAGAGTDGSQFFIIYKDSSTSLGKDYTEVGTISAGMDIVQQIAAGGEDDSNGAGDGKPKVTLTFTKVTVAPPVTGSGTMVTPVPTAPVASSSVAATPSTTAQSSPAASAASSSG
jgi:peptidyl-prolyl cis-trans isomerase B (cyclophilin B)